MSIQENINRVLAATTIGAGARASFKAQEAAKLAKQEEREYIESRAAAKHQMRLDEIKAKEEADIARSQRKIEEIKTQGEEKRKTRGQELRAQTKQTKLKSEAAIAEAMSKQAIAESRAKSLARMEQGKNARAKMQLEKAIIKAKEKPNG